MILRMIVDRDMLQSVCNVLNKLPIVETPPNIPGVRFYREWHFEVENSSAVPEAYRKPA